MFVKTKEYNTVTNVINYGDFYTLYVAGPKGCGKTQTILHAADDHGKDIVRVNITYETDEDALIGHYNLLGGETVFEDGPVIAAMKAGKILLLDEIDLGSPLRLMCLQSILEGNSYHNKRTGELVKPKSGFKIIATANTKGTGDETGNYTGTQVLNGAFMDRFSSFINFPYLSVDDEKRILFSIKTDNKVDIDDGVIDHLVSWGQKTRIAGDGDIDLTISTRKLIDIVKSIPIYGDIENTIRHCISMFPSDVVDSMIENYKLISSEIPDTLSVNKGSAKRTYNWQKT